MSRPLRTACVPLALGVLLAACSSSQPLARIDAAAPDARGDAFAPLDVGACGTRLDPVGCPCDPSVDRERDCVTFSGPVCRGGRTRCEGTGEIGMWGACTGQVDGHCPCTVEGHVQACGTGANGEPGQTSACGPGTSTCHAGTWSPCVLPVCPDGGVDGGDPDGGGGCDRRIAPPRLIAPLSTARVSSWRPTLRWELPAGTDGARIEICADRACATVVETLDVFGTTTNPTRDLTPRPSAPTSVYYWRAAGLVRDAGTGLTRAGCVALPGGGSPTWEFFVSHRSAPNDTSWGAVLDVNGDGFADVAVVEPYATYPSNPSLFGVVHVYHGGAAGLGATPVASLRSPGSEPGLFGGAVHALGDVNGDGFGDLLVQGYLGIAGGPGGLVAHPSFVFLGGAAGLTTAPIRIAPPASTPIGTTGTGYTVYHATAAGDVNRDGYADLVIERMTAPDQLHAAADLVAGGPTGPGATTLATVMFRPYINADYDFGISDGMLVAAGDLNGDGYADLGFTYGGYDGAGPAYAAGPVYLGGRPPGTTPVANLGLSLSKLTSAFNDGHVGAIGDVNGDGRADMALAWIRVNNPTSLTGLVRVHLGTATGLAMTPGMTLAMADSAEDDTSSRPRGGDVDGDGYADVVLGDDSGSASDTGAVGVFRGGPAGPSRATPDWVVSGPDGMGSEFGGVLDVGDVNGDGFADVVVAAPYVGSVPGVMPYCMRGGRVHVYHGGASGPASTPATSLDAPPIAIVGTMGHCFGSQLVASGGGGG